MAENAANAFGPGAAKADGGEFERERDRLHAKIGQQAVELGWFAKKVQTARPVRDRARQLEGNIPE
jgi:hypothetical protein